MISARETERRMKLQDVILKAIASKITWIEAVEIDGSKHRWSPDDRYYDLIVIPDDSGGEIY